MFKFQFFFEAKRSTVNMVQNKIHRDESYRCVFFSQLSLNKPQFSLFSSIGPTFVDLPYWSFGFDFWNQTVWTDVASIVDLLVGNNWNRSNWFFIWSFTPSLFYRLSSWFQLFVLINHTLIPYFCLSWANWYLVL